MATADLRYPSPQDFLAELEAFSQAVANSEYYDEDAAEYYNDDSDYYDYRYDDEEAYEGRLPVFANWYSRFMEEYKRFRALRAGMEAKVGPVLCNRPVKGTNIIDLTR